MNRRLLWALAATLAGSAALAWWPGDEGEPVAAVVAPTATHASRGIGADTPPPAARPAPASATAVAVAAEGAERAERRADWPAPSAQALAAWQPALPPAPAAPPSPASAGSAPARAAPPAFPYQWIGRLDKGGRAQALLAGPHAALAVAEGATIDRQWLLSQVAEHQLTLTWLPGGDTVTVAARPPR